MGQDMKNIENIGNVKINLQYYNGKDLYSDGDIEDSILDIVKNNPEEKFNEIIFDRKDWAVMYHLSDIRKNIVDTVEFKKNARVLEIGAGCGAITGILADKVRSVTSVELSKKRSMINAYRNQHKSNVEIMVGNFQDIEGDLGQFDYITLIGVFEYADAYIDAENPYVEFLKIIKEHLSPEGKIIIAIENKLGLKYFAGCKEDHFGTYFEGIENYVNTEGIRTFTRRELEEMFKEVGMDEYVFYYPYPDYKFPLKIFSDAYLPRFGELDSNVLNFDRDRMLLFDEKKVFNTIIKEDMFPIYSNSFLIEIGKADSKVIYKKYSNDRAEEFSIYTDMVLDESGSIKVRKYAAFDKSQEHIKRIIKWSDMLKTQYEGSPLSVCESIEEDGKAVSEYLDGRTLEELADWYIYSGREEQAEQVIRKLIAVILEKNALKDFEITSEFIEIFGNVEFEGHMHSGIVNDIDMVLGNIIESNGTWKLIDYEWCFDFPVPVEFIIYRMLFYYLDTNNSRNLLKKKEFIHLSEKDKRTFDEMEKRFQDYVDGRRRPLRKMYERFGKDVIDLHFMVNMEKSFSNVKLYKESGNGYSEELSVSAKASCLNGYDKYAFSFEVEDTVVKYRFDPCECACVLKIEDLSADEGMMVSYHTNGIKVEDDMYIFGPDPWIEFEMGGCNIKKVYIEYSLREISPEYGEAASSRMIKDERAIENLIADSRNLKNQLERLQSILDNMENSASWKITKPLRSIRNAVRKNH